MNILVKIVDDIKRSIPLEILQIAFQDDLQNWRRAPVSLDEMILTKLIKPKVMVDANVVAGEAILIPLNGVQPEYRDDFSVIYQVPPRMTHNREIISILSVAYLPYSGDLGSFGAGYSTIAPVFNNDVSGAFESMAESYSNIPQVSTASADLIGYNRIRVTDPNRVISSYMLRCYVTNDDYLNNINPRSYLDIAELAQWGCKAFIYNKLIIRMGSAQLQNGQELGAFKNVVDTYADAWASYNTFLREVWTKVAHMNNSGQHERYIRMQIPIGL